MRARIASILNISVDQVGIKAKTGEKTGDLGESRLAEAFCTAPALSHIETLFIELRNRTSCREACEIPAFRGVSANLYSTCCNCVWSRNRLDFACITEP